MLINVLLGVGLILGVLFIIIIAATPSESFHRFPILHSPKSKAKKKAENRPLNPTPFDLIPIDPDATDTLVNPQTYRNEYFMTMRAKPFNSKEHIGTINPYNDQKIQSKQDYYAYLQQYVYTHLFSDEINKLTNERVRAANARFQEHRRRRRRLSAILLTLFLVIGFFSVRSAIRSSYDSGSADAQADAKVKIETAYDNGVKSGYADGQQDGYNEGQEAGEKIGYDNGYDEGYEAGESEGTLAGYDRCYNIYVDELRFYRNNVCVVTVSGKKYHHWDCFHIQNHDFYIYNTEKAESLGYTPCLDCWESGLMP